MLDFLNPIKGFGVTFHEMFRKPETVYYPEEQAADRAAVPRPPPAQPVAGRAGEMHRLRAVRLGLPGRRHLRRGPGQHPEDRFSPGERYGAVYQINYLRCILCGMCIEACPTRALTMTNEYEIADDSRENLIWTKEQLLVPLLPGMEAPPHPMRLGDDEKDYYRLGAAGLTAGPRAPGMSGPGRPVGPGGVRRIPGRLAVLAAARGGPRGRGGAGRAEGGPAG